MGIHDIAMAAAADVNASVVLRYEMARSFWRRFWFRFYSIDDSKRTSWWILAVHSARIDWSFE
jgi:hypothetical protein